VTDQIWAWFATFEGNVNQTNTVNFEAHWISGTPQKGGFEIPLATDSTRLVVKFLPLKQVKINSCLRHESLEKLKKGDSRSTHTLPQAA